MTPTFVDSLSNLSYLIGGNPCGGTHFVANYLTAAGYPCGHESLYLIGTDRFALNENQTLDAFTELRAVCSYTTVEHCHVPPADHIPLILVLRNPFHVLNSLIKVALEHNETINPNQIMVDILDRYRNLLATGRVVFMLRVEYDLPKLCDFLHIKPVDPAAIYRAPRNQGRIRLTWDEIKGYPNAASLSNFAFLHGYKRLTCADVDYSI